MIKAIKKTLLAQNMIPLVRSDLESVIAIRHYNDLGDYIYNFDDDVVTNDKELFPKEMETQKYANMDSLKRFDYLDFVIMDVNSALLPWQVKS